MLHRHAPRRKPVNEHGLKQFRPGRGERISGLVAQRCFQRRRCGQGHSVFADEAAEAAAVPFVLKRAGQQREVNAAPGFVPSAKCAGGHILPDAFRSAAQKRQFPVMDCARPVGGQVGHPVTLDKPVYDRHRAVLNEVRAIQQDHAGTPLAGVCDLQGALANRRKRGRVAGARRLAGINQDLVNRAQALPLGQRIDSYLSQVKGFREFLHSLG